MEKIVRLDIVDYDADYSERLQGTFYLVNPDEEKLMQLKYMIETRFDNAPDNEIDWSTIYDYINENFEKIDVEKFEIKW